MLVETWQNMVYNTALGIVQNAEDAGGYRAGSIRPGLSVNQFIQGRIQAFHLVYRIAVTKSLDLELEKRKNALLSSAAFSGSRTTSHTTRPISTTRNQP